MNRKHVYILGLNPHSHRTPQNVTLMFTFSGHHHTGHSVRYTGASSEQSESHNCIRDAESLTCINITAVSLRGRRRRIFSTHKSFIPQFITNMGIQGVHLTGQSCTFHHCIMATTNIRVCLLQQHQASKDHQLIQTVVTGLITNHWRQDSPSRARPLEIISVSHLFSSVEFLRI